MKSDVRASNRVADPSANSKVKSRSSPSFEWWEWLTALSKGTSAINDVYLENVAALENELNDPELARDPRMHDFVVPDDCVWDKVARTTERELGTALNDAMRAIERANEPKFDGILANSTVDFNAQDRLPRAKLVQIVNHFGSLPLDHASVPDDLFGNAYEYLIRNFASKAADMPLAIQKCLLSAKTGRWAWLGSGDLIQLHPSWSSLWP